MSSRLLHFIPVCVVLLTTSACREAKIVTYKTPKEAGPPAAAATPAPADDPHAGLGIPPVNSSAAPAPASGPTAAPAGTDMASTAVPTASGADLSWTAPAAWQTRPASAMRKATFILTGASASEQAELAVTAFPGDVGGLLANVNRWRGQLQLPPVDAAALHSTLTHLDINTLHVELVELVGPEAPERKRVLGAIVPVKGSTWFFKLTGPDAFVAAKKADFLGFLQTIKTN
jgi:hypothetical protein